MRRAVWNPVRVRPGALATRALLIAAVAALVAATAGADGATAAEPKRPSAALRAYGLDWIQYIRPRDLSPTRPAICIVDTGVAITPDTPPDNPNGPIVKRLSIDDGSGEPQGTSPAHGHGTRMAATAIAPRNGWGTVGMFPQGRVISVRATVNGESTFRVAQYVRGIRSCLESGSPVAAINLSIGCTECPPNEDSGPLVETVQNANQRGIPVFVAAGNTPGALPSPADIPGVIPIAAGGVRGKLCGYAAWDPSVFAIAPACPIESAEPFSGAFESRANGGSSAASVQVAALVAALAAVRPERSVAEALDLVRAGSRTVDRRATVNGRRAAVAGGMRSVVRRADRAQRGQNPR